MDTIRLEAPGQLTRVDTPQPDAPGEGQTLVAVRRVGVCGSDLHAFHGRQPFFSYPRILGHELGVEVVECSDGSIAAGTACTVVPYIACGHCVSCDRGRPNCCANLQVIGIHCDGGMRERFVVPTSALLPAADLNQDQLALAETLAIGTHAVARARPRPDDVAVVVGIGPIGLGVATRLRALGIPTLLLDRSEARLQAAQDRFGFAPADLVQAATTNPDDDFDALRKAGGGELPTLLVDATGAPPSMNRAVELVAPSGQVVMVGLHKEQLAFTDLEFHRKELTLLASRNATREDFVNVLDDMRSGRVQSDWFVTHRTDMQSLVGALPGYTDPAAGVVKAMLEIDA